MSHLLAKRPSSHAAEDDDGEMVDARKPWPTPTPAQWAEVEMVSFRVMVLLEWATAELHDKKHSPEETEDLIRLKQALVLLLHQLLLRHILDPNLDMQGVFRYSSLL